ncbi:CD209 antigen-like protein [Mactra antiquata]
MKTLQVYLSILVQLYIGARFCSAVCPNGWTRFEQSCYFFGHHDETFKDAERTCASYGAYIVAIESSTENTFIGSMLTQLNSNRHWIGLTDEVIEGIWTWYHNGERATYTDWHPTQPDRGADSNCANILSTAPYAYHWLDDTCTSQFRVICEKEDNQGEIVG